MKIGLGTAQFGLDYGISNRSGQVVERQVREIIALAERSGVRIVDTASVYGDAEERLGRALSPDHRFQIVTKLPRLPDDLEIAATDGWARTALAASRARLGADTVYGLLIHHVDDLLGPRGPRLWSILESLRSDGAVERIGVSIYTARDLDSLLDRYPLQLVQVPINVFDQRLLKSGHLGRLKALGIEVHARSIFLQGLLLMDPDCLGDTYFDPVRKPLAAFQSAALATGCTPLQAAVSFAISIDEVDAALVGVTDAPQLAEIIAAAAPAVARDWYLPFALEDERILDPSRWPT
jgi:aryl-alcohol dehydrogenase-like predicted oxidoreductase